MVLYLKGLLSCPNKVIKFEQVRDSKRTTHYVSGVPDLCTDLITGEVFDPSSLSIVYVQEREDNFDPDIAQIKKYCQEYKDTYTNLFLNEIVTDLFNISVVNRCRLFGYYGYESVRSQDEAFVAWAKVKWVEFISARRVEVETLLHSDRVEFRNTKNEDGVNEIDTILEVIVAEFREASEKIKTATSYPELVKIWPAVLLPRPKGA